jgi:hypothetical protein
MVTIHKLDTDISEDVLDLLTLVKDRVNEFKTVHTAKIIKAGNLPTPSGLPLQYYKVFKIIFDGTPLEAILVYPFIAIINNDTDKLNVVQVDPTFVGNEISTEFYAYNLYTNDRNVESTVYDIYEELDSAVETAIDADMFSVESTTDSVAEFLYEFTGKLLEDVKLTVDQAEEISEWLGYSIPDKEIN